MPSRVPYLILVDDDVAQSAALAYALGGRGYQVTCARRRASAMALIGATVPDLIVVELELLRRSAGWTIVRWLRRNPATAHIPVVATTAPLAVPRELLDDLARLRIAVLQQPWSVEQLARAIRRQLGHAGE